MKFQILTHLLALGAVSRVVAVTKVNYNGFKAVRVFVGEDVIPLADVIRQLSLPTWKGAQEGIPIPNRHVDLVVPADKVAKFEELTSSMTTEVMHEDLGLSIASEGHTDVHDGKSDLGHVLTEL